MTEKVAYLLLALGALSLVAWFTFGPRQVDDRERRQEIARWEQVEPWQMQAGCEQGKPAACEAWEVWNGRYGAYPVRDDYR